MFSTPWIRVMVTMSPLDTWVISWPSTPSTSSGFMLRRSPVETATRALFARAPVANALGCGESNMATSGMPMFAARARFWTVLTEPALGVVLRLRDHADAHQLLGGPLRDQRRDEGAAEAPDRRKGEQALHALRAVEPRVDSDDVGDDRGDQQDREVR